MSIDPKRVAQIVREEIEQYLKGRTFPVASPVSQASPIQESVSFKESLLAIFLGSTRGLDSVTLALRNLARSGHSSVAHFSPSTAHILDKAKVLQDAEVARVLDDLPLGRVSEFIRGFKAVVVPSLTRNTAAKLALGITDSALTYTLLVALGNKVPVIAGRDGMYPDADTDCTECALDLPGMRNILGAYERVLTEFGMQIVAAKDVGATLQRFFAVPSSAEGSALDGLITAETAAAISGSKVVLGRRAVVTPLAMDIFKERKITVERQDK